MTYRLLLLGLVMLVQPGSTRTVDKITEKVNTMEDDLSFSLLANVRDKFKYIDTHTAGNTRCRSDHKCGFHQGTNYKWCYVNDNNNWDYCCAGKCKRGGDSLRCKSGTLFVVCGKPGIQTALRRACLPSHPCGYHENGGYSLYYWCYVDNSNDWDYCCHPNSKCSKKGYSYYWCNSGVFSQDRRFWAYCEPK